MKTQVISYYNASVVDTIFPSNLELLPNTHELFAIDLAYGEYLSLSINDLVKRSAFFAKINDKPTVHFRLCLGTPLEKIRSGKTVWVRSFFQANRFSTGYASHSLFPYRGKFHPQLVKGILNIMKVQEGETILDPMAGSGTACVEANIMNINAIGVDINPFCTIITKAKLHALDLNSVRLEKYANTLDILSKVRKILREKSETKNADEFISKLRIVGDKKIDTVLLLSYLDAVGYARRRKTASIEDLFPVVLKRYVETIKSFTKTRRALGIELGNTLAYTGNVLSLNLSDSSIDGIVTSPPYSFAIDYVENDRPQLELLNVNVDRLRQNMIGLQGKTRKDKVENYFQMMDRAIEEMSRVLKKGKCCVIIVGSNEIQTGGIRLEKKFKEFAKKHSLELFKDLIKPIIGIRNSMREEHILFFQKKN